MPRDVAKPVVKHRAIPQMRAGYSAPITSTVVTATTAIADVSAHPQTFPSELEVIERYRDTAFAALPDADGQPVMEGALADDGIILHGYVRESKDSFPLAKATVTLLGGNRRSFRAYADDRGYYQFRESYFPDGVPSGAYTLSVYPDIHGDGTRVIESDVRDGFTIDATKRQRFDFILKNETATTPMPHARYYGRVTDGRTGKPLSGATVTIYKRGTPTTERAIANADGFYQFSWTQLQDTVPNPGQVEFFYVHHMSQCVRKEGQPCPVDPTRGPEFFTPKDPTRREYHFALTRP